MTTTADRTHPSMTLAQWKSYFAEKFLGYHQRGPSDVDGYERDARIRQAVAEAPSWDAISAAVPLPWQDAAANRCRRNEV